MNKKKTKSQDYFIEAIVKSGEKVEIVTKAFNSAIIDYVEERIDEKLLSSVARTIYFEVSDPPNSIHDWQNSYMTSLIADLFEYDYDVYQSEKNDKAKSRVEKTEEKIKDYYKRITQ